MPDSLEYPAAPASELPRLKHQEGQQVNKRLYSSNLLIDLAQVDPTHKLPKRDVHAKHGDYTRIALGNLQLPELYAV
jgi:hypothetical protein